VLQPLVANFAMFLLVDCCCLAEMLCCNSGHTLHMQPCTGHVCVCWGGVGHANLNDVSVSEKRQ
jgi:hypothetical protein